MTLRIATFNLKDFFAPKDEGERAVVEAKVANVAGNLRRAAAHVVALQEVGSEELVDRLVTRELADMGYGNPVFGTEDRRGIRNVIVSRLPILWSQVHAPKSLTFPRFVEGDPEPFASRIPLRRGVVHVRVDGGSLGEVDVLTAHFKSNLGAPMKTADGREIPDDSQRGRGEAALRSLVQRAAEALFVRGLVDDVLRSVPDHSICVLGDLNDTADSLPLRALRGLDRGPCRLHACLERVAPEQRFSCFHAGDPTLIDHILASERLHLRLADAAIYNEALRYHGPHTDEPPLTEDSDHALAVAEFR